MSSEEEHQHKESESLMEKITGHHHHDENNTKKKKDDSSSSSSSSSDSDDESSKISAMKNKAFRLFGREKPLHKVFGGGKPADLLLWKDKKLSGGILGGVSVVWFLFEVLEYHLLTLVCHSLILSLAVLFLWSNASTFINKSPPKIPEVSIPEKPLLEIVSALRIEINQGLAAIRDIASGKDLKKFLAVIAGLWFVSIISNCYSFLTLVYILVVVLFTVPVAYDKFEDKIDPLAEKAWIEIKKQYAVLDAKVLCKIPRSIKELKEKKRV